MRSGSTSSVQVLLDARATVDAREMTAATPLMWAAFVGSRYKKRLFESAQQRLLMVSVLGGRPQSHFGMHGSSIDSAKLLRNISALEARRFPCRKKKNSAIGKKTLSVFTRGSAMFSCLLV